MSVFVKHFSKKGSLWDKIQIGKSPCMKSFCLNKGQIRYLLSELFFYLYSYCKSKERL